MDLRKLKTLIDLVETSGIAELEIQEGEERVRVCRESVSTRRDAFFLPPSRERGNRGNTPGKPRQTGLLAFPLLEER